jgi:hypothetical protein
MKYTQSKRAITPSQMVEFKEFNIKCKRTSLNTITLILYCFRFLYIEDRDQQIVSDFSGREDIFVLSCQYICPSVRKIIVAISFIGGGNQGTRRKPQTMRPVASY